jgi:segregation and condensation protein A
MNFQVTTGEFEGPLALLLSLIEKRELDISQVSLASITEEYVKHIEEVEVIAPNELADFLVIASRLLYIKSKALLPELDLDMEEESIGLAEQLRMYQRYAQASERLEAMLVDGKEAYKAPRMQISFEAFSPPDLLTAHNLRDSLMSLIQRVRPYIELPKQMMERTVTVEEKIALLKEKITNKAKAYFHELAHTGSRSDLVTSFLALLELLKQNIVRVEQRDIFEDIAIHKV